MTRASRLGLDGRGDGPFQCSFVHSERGKQALPPANERREQNRCPPAHFWKQLNLCNSAISGQTREALFGSASSTIARNPAVCIHRMRASCCLSLSPSHMKAGFSGG